MQLRIGKLTAYEKEFGWFVEYRVQVGCPSFKVNYSGFRNRMNRKTGLLDPAAQIGLLVVHEKDFIKPPYFLKHRSLYHHIGPTDGPYRFTVSGIEMFSFVGIRDIECNTDFP